MDWNQSSQAFCAAYLLILTSKRSLLDSGNLGKYSVVKLRISPLTVFFYAISGLGMLVYKQTGYMCVGDIKKKKKKVEDLFPQQEMRGERKKL